jgi:hypothetical protein
MVKRVITGIFPKDTDMQKGRPCNSLKNADNVSYLSNKISYSTKTQQENTNRMCGYGRSPLEILFGNGKYQKTNII